jgi:hypothetical protein
MVLHRRERREPRAEPGGMGSVLKAGNTTSAQLDKPSWEYGGSGIPKLRSLCVLL